jgi:mono/diheme cytochrome c family protein
MQERNSDKARRTASGGLFLFSQATFLFNSKTMLAPLQSEHGNFQGATMSLTLKSAAVLLIVLFTAAFLPAKDAEVSQKPRAEENAKVAAPSNADPTARVEALEQQVQELARQIKGQQKGSSAAGMSKESAAQDDQGPPPSLRRMDPPAISSDRSVKYDYDIVYVRAPRVARGRDGRERQADVWPNAQSPTQLRASTDLMLLHPDGSEVLLVSGGAGGIADPYVSFDAEWVYYTYFHDVSGDNGADVYKVHVKTRKIVRLTRQEWTPNTGVTDSASHSQSPKSMKGMGSDSVYNMHPCPLPGGRVAFVSNRDGFKPPRNAQRSLQLFVIDDDGANTEKIGYLNVGEALHPVILADGRIIFSSLEVQGLHNMGWGILAIRPDGTQWEPIISALAQGGAPKPFHFQTQMSDGSIVVGNYYIPAMAGFGTYFKQPPRPPEGTPAFGPARPQNLTLRFGAKGAFGVPFQPYGMDVLTRFSNNEDHIPLRADPTDSNSIHAGWVTQPCGAPDNHLLTVWTGALPPDRSRIVDDRQPALDSGIYLIKNGKPTWEPGDMLLVKNDPNYNEQWPRPLVPYRRIYGIDEPKLLPALCNDGSLAKALPEGTPFGLVGTSSLYKRESYPGGVVPEGSVTAIGSPFSAFPTRAHRTNWDGQGADAGLYSNSDIHAIRILAMEPASLPVVGKFSNQAGERLRILGEIPVRKFQGNAQPIDPDGNPDTSFLARIPANVAWTFQTLDKDGMVLNMAQTWHQVRPGEVRNNCGGCHAHSQQPTRFSDTAAARPEYQVFDLTRATPLLTTREKDESGKKWDVENKTGLRYAKGVLNVEYRRDIEPIFARSCVACHSAKSSKPAGDLVLDDATSKDRLPTTYRTLVRGDGKTGRYIWPFQSRTGLLTWKIFGRRTDNFPEAVPADTKSDYSAHLARGGDPYSAFEGSIMPPPQAVAGDYKDPDGRTIKVEPLSDEDRRTIVRWIDLGCPIDLDDDVKNPGKPGRGWMLDDQRPTLAVTLPRAGVNSAPVDRVLLGMHDYGTGIDEQSFTVTADIELDGVPAGHNLRDRFVSRGDAVWEWRFQKPLASLEKAVLTVSIKDRQGNQTRVERTFSVQPVTTRRE